jgi:SAM-dependent methyltransferase
MNLFEMHRRTDPHLVVGAGATPAKVTMFGRGYRGFEMKAGAHVQVRMPLLHHPFRDFPTNVGWLAWATGKNAQLSVSYLEPGHVPIVHTHQLLGAPQSLVIPYPYYRVGKPESALLDVHCTKDECFFAVNEVSTRSDLLSLCSGNGLEIGPGHQPQILPSASVHVRYVEEKPQSDWLKSYASHGEQHKDHGLWDHYIQGVASDLPVGPGELDFIFASHLFEHLSNPLGHLEYWSSRMKPDGKVVCIVPEPAGTKDYVYRLSSMDEWLSEYRESLWKPSLHHYRRFAAGRGNIGLAEKWQQDQYSIHAHFYSPTNLGQLLRYATDAGWFRHFRIIHLPNGKDFFFWLQR